MIFNITLLIIILIVLQLIVGHFWHDIGFSYTQSILLMCLPFRYRFISYASLYYERRYPNWEVPLNIKLRLKYMYILTLLEYVAVYICLFILK